MSNKLTGQLQDLLNGLKKILHGSKQNTKPSFDQETTKPSFDQETTSELQKSCDSINSALSDSNTMYPKVITNAVTFFALSKAADTPNRLADIAQFFNTSVITSTRVISANWVAKGAFVVELELAAGCLRIDFTTLHSSYNADVSLSINLTKP
jgi:hypothetical protein